MRDNFASFPRPVSLTMVLFFLDFRPQKQQCQSETRMDNAGGVNSPSSDRLPAKPVARRASLDVIRAGEGTGRSLARHFAVTSNSPKALRP